MLIPAIIAKKYESQCLKCLEELTASVIKLSLPVGALKCDKWHFYS